MPREEGLELDNDWNPMPVEIMISTFGESGTEDIRMYLPSEFREKLDDIPDYLCISKEVGWMTCVVFVKENLECIMKFLYQDRMINKEFRWFLNQNISENLKLVSFWD